MAGEQSLVVTGLEALAKQLPFTALGIDSDNDSVFINDSLMRYCADRGIEFTRSRAYRKNDQAWVEQKNGAVIRRSLGHERYSGTGGGADHSSPARSDETVRELFPALVQADGENTQRLSGDQALQSAGHALRAGNPA